MNKLQRAEQLRRAIQLFAASLDEADALEVATLYPAYQVGRAYTAGTYLRQGADRNGDPQLYRVLQDHTSQEGWPPESTPALYGAMGLDEDGYPLWSQPGGVYDAYNAGDVVSYNGVLYQSLVDGNVWAPNVYPAGWTVYVGE